GDAEGQLRIWDVATAQPRGSIQGPAGNLAAVAVRPDGARIAAVSDRRTLSVVEVATGREVFRARQQQTAGGAYSPDGRWLASMGEGRNTLCLWDAQTHQLVAQFTGPTGRVHAIAFSPDGRRLVSGGEDRTVRVWDVGTGRCQDELHGHTDTVFAAA